MKNEEHQIQGAIVKLARMMPHPVNLLYAIPNGGLRDIRVARKMKAEGQLAGVPDLFLPHAAHGYHGLYIEVKTPKGALSQAQATIMGLLEKEGYATHVVRSVSEALRVLNWYVGR
jgi:hypothetical protein